MFSWRKAGSFHVQEAEYYANINEFDMFLICNLKSTLKDKLFKKFYHAQWISFLSHLYSQVCTMI